VVAVQQQRYKGFLAIAKAEVRPDRAGSSYAIVKGTVLSPRLRPIIDAIRRFPVELMDDEVRLARAEQDLLQDLLRRIDTDLRAA
jgi:hypothetical protein